MQLIRYIKNIKIDNSVVAIGNFDGIHLGHQKLLNEAQKIAKKFSLPLIILTFQPHPIRIILPNQQHKLILTYRDKIKALAKYNIDYLLIQRFDKKFALVNSEQFFLNFLIKQLKAKHIIVGENFKFGSDQADIKLLEVYTKKSNTYCHIIDLLNDSNMIISSSAIKTQLSEGELKNVQQMLGKEYHITAKIIKLQNTDINIKLNQNLALKPGTYRVIFQNPKTSDQINSILLYYPNQNLLLKLDNIIKIKTYSYITITVKQFLHD